MSFCVAWRVETGIRSRAAAPCSPQSLTAVLRVSRDGGGFVMSPGPKLRAAARARTGNGRFRSQEIAVNCANVNPHPR